VVYTPPRRKLTADEYQRMGETGIFHEDDRVELIDGELYEMTPIGDGHIGAIDSLNSLLNRLLGDRAIVSIQNPIQVGDHHEPQPDVTVLRPRADDYASAVPIAEDVLLVVEVADSSADYDRGTKAPLYARGGIAELWIVDLNRDHLAAYREPTSAGYATTRVLRRGESICPLAFPELEITVDEILG